jgi:ATP-binding cassette subfamily F protein 3
MNILNMSQVSKDYAGDRIFEEIKFELNDNDCVGLVGRNGEGKTTLLKLMADVEPPTEGWISWSKEATIGLLDQIPDYAEDYVVYDCLNDVFKDLLEIEEKMTVIEEKMTLEDTDIDYLLKKYSRLQETFEKKDGYQKDSQIRRVAHGLKISHLLNAPFGELSGGERTKVGLAQILLKRPTLLLLDEPTNHLDISSIEWLTDFLKQYNGAVVIVSHDRYFLDETVNQIIEIDQGNLHVYHGNYTHFTKEKEERILREFEAYKTQQKKIQKMKQSIKQLRLWASQAKPPNAAMYRRAKSMEKALNRIQILDKPMLEAPQMNMSLKEGKRVSDDVFILDGVSKMYDDILFENIHMLIRRREHVAIIGDNGTGKSTILKMMSGEVGPDEGQVEAADNVKIGYLSQHTFGDSNNMSVIEMFRDVISVTEGKARQLLAQFMFYGEDVFKKVNQLSGGEKMRLRWAQIVNQDFNVLILDEPTNHLDIESKETLEESLVHYDGTIIAVSHDRYFLNRLFNTTYWLKDRCLYKFEGNYDYAKEKMTMKNR